MPAEARAIAQEAYIYGYRLVDNYRVVEHSYFVDHASLEFKAPWNQMANIPRVFTPAASVIDVAYCSRRRNGNAARPTWTEHVDIVRGGSCEL
jgi:hypothetical protein